MLSYMLRTRAILKLQLSVARMSRMTSSVPALSTCLEGSASDKYYILFNGGAVNHMPHGVIALHRLGASYERIQQFKDYYVELRDLRDVDGFLQQRHKYNATKHDPFYQHPESFYQMVSQYESLLRDKYGTLDKLIAGEFPALAGGVAGLAFHGLIHLGHGYLAQHEKLTLEGLALLKNYYCCPKVAEEDMEAKLGDPGNMDLLDVLKMVAQDKDLTEMSQKEITGHEQVDRNTKGFLPHKAAVMFTMRGEKILRYANLVNLHPGLVEGSRCALQDGMLWLINQAVTLYACAEEVNNFYFIHGVTSSWCLKHLIPQITDRTCLNKAIRAYLCGLIATYVTQGNPRVSPQFRSEVSPDLDTWPKIAHHTLREDRDEHIYKLVQVCKSLNEECADPHMAPVYISAANSALCYPLKYGCLRF